MANSGFGKPGFDEILGRRAATLRGISWGRISVGEILKADLDEIRALGAQLSVKAKDIADVVQPARTGVSAVVMPDAGIDNLLGRIVTTMESTVAKHSSAVQSLSNGAVSSAVSYEAVEDAFARQLGVLTDGLRR